MHNALAVEGGLSPCHLTSHSMPPRRGIPQSRSKPLPSGGSDLRLQSSKRIGERIYKLRMSKDPPWTQRQLAEFASAYADKPLSQQIIHMYETGSRTRPKFLPEIAMAFGISVEELVRGPDAPSLPSPPATAADPPSMIPIIGTAAAGVWTEIEAFNQDEPERVHRYLHEKWGAMEQFAVRVSGNSVNKRLADGSIAICTPYDDASPSSKDMVLAVLRKGQLEQWTLKVLQVRENQIELWPHSNDPRFVKPFRFDLKKRRQVDDNDVTLEIKGLVIAGIVPDIA